MEIFPFVYFKIDYIRSRFDLSVICGFTERQKNEDIFIIFVNKPKKGLNCTLVNRICNALTRFSLKHLTACSAEVRFRSALLDS